MNGSWLYCCLFGHADDQHPPGIISNFWTRPDGKMVYTHDICGRCRAVIRINDKTEYSHWYASQFTILPDGPTENLYSTKKDSPVIKHKLSLGLTRLRIEGAPLHPDDLDWEHYPGEGCFDCEAKWNRQLAAYNEWYRGYYHKDPP
jgi:hypothetical protein